MTQSSNFPLDTETEKEKWVKLFTKYSRDHYSNLNLAFGSGCINQTVFTLVFQNLSQLLVKVSVKISLSSKLQYLMKSSQLLTPDILLRTAPGVCNLVPVSANPNPSPIPASTNQKSGSASIEAQLLANWSLPLV